MIRMWTAWQHDQADCFKTLILRFGYGMMGSSMQFGRKRGPATKSPHDLFLNSVYRAHFGSCLYRLETDVCIPAHGAPEGVDLVCLRGIAAAFAPSLCNRPSRDQIPVGGSDGLGCLYKHRFFFAFVLHDSMSGCLLDPAKIDPGGVGAVLGHG